MTFKLITRLIFSICIIASGRASAVVIDLIDDLSNFGTPLNATLTNSPA